MNTILNFISSKEEEKIIYEISVFFCKVDFSIVEKNVLEIIENILIFINEKYDGVIYINTLKALKQISFYLANLKFFDIFPKFDTFLQKEKIDSIELISFLLFMSANDKLNFFLFFDSAVFEKIKILTFKNFEIGFSSLQLLKKGICINPGLILKKKFFDSFLFFLDKNFEFNEFYFFLDFFYESIKYYKLSLLILIDSDLLPYIFQLIKSFNKNLLILKNQKNFWASLIFLKIIKILNFILSEKMRKVFFLRYIKELMNLELFEEIENFLLFGLNNKLHIHFIKDFYFPNSENDDTEEFINYLHFYCSKYLENQKEIIIFSKIVNIEKFFIFQKTQYNSSSQIIYEKKNYILKNKVFLEQAYPKGEYDILQLDLKENYSYFLENLKSLLYGVKYFEIFYIDSKNDFQIVNNQKSYIEFIYDSLLSGRNNNFILENDIIIKNIVEDIGQCDYCGAIEKLIALKQYNGSFYCHSCYDKL